jgi:hypothetical protein
MVVKVNISVLSEQYYLLYQSILCEYCFYYYALSSHACVVKLQLLVCEHYRAIRGKEAVSDNKVNSRVT